MKRSPRLDFAKVDWSQDRTDWRGASWAAAAMLILIAMACAV